MSPPVENLKPIRAEVLGVERLAEHAYELARADVLLPATARGRPLLPRLRANRQALGAARRIFADAVQQQRTIPPAAEWLLDNFYIIEEQFREIRQDLTQSYYRELPKLAQGPYAGYPRVYGLAVEIIAYTDSRLDDEVLVRCVQAYQSAAALSMGELWAIAIMLRVGLIENLRRLIDETVAVTEKRADADTWAERMLNPPSHLATEVFIAIADLAKHMPELDPVFAVHLLQRLRDQDPSVAPAINWLEQRVVEQGTHVEAVVRGEHQRRAANRVSVGNVITSMRVLSAIDWRDFFESTSLVERVLSQDPPATYEAMDFATRDQYRHVVERLSRHSRYSEEQVAQRAIELVTHWRQAHASTASGAREGHVGYYLVAHGLPMLKADLGYRPEWRERVSSIALDHPTPFYLGLLSVLTLCFIGLALSYAASIGAAPVMLALVALFTALPASALAINIVNRTLTNELTPRALPKLEFQVIPPECRTLVAVPVLISHLEGIQHLLESLEVRFLANRDENLAFALLGDFGDAPHEQMPEDEALLEAARSGILALNAKYGGGREDRFYLFHRARKWNPREQAWMGWERKRGKLVEFNRLLRGATDTTFIIQVGDVAALSEPPVKYVITLDADTELPINSARRLIGTLAHPLNQARTDPATRRVVEGYGIIQPRTAATAIAASRSRFAVIFAGDAGLDPYTHAVSDVYQDLFGTGIFVGKGIYDVDAALTVLAERFPENTLLSHDLIEGAFARTGLATDIELLEDFPSGYDAYMQRQHRWIRGDWQISDWLFSSVPTATGRRVRNRLPLIERWKIFDNLRRSLVEPIALLLLIAGWTVLPGSPLFWTAAVVLSLVFPQLVDFIVSFGAHPKGEPWIGYFWALVHELYLNGVRAVLTLTFLPFRAIISLDALLRVAWRRIISRRNLLEWISHAAVEHGQARTLRDYWASMWGAPALGLGVLLLVVGMLFARAGASLGALASALPILVLWWSSPFVGYYLSQPLVSEQVPLSEEARRALRVMARKTWRFFETFAGEEDHWLPPDHYQEDPKGAARHTTSPTNIGFLLLSTLAAYDFGYVGAIELAERLERTLATLEKLERYHGHFYNWYDTLTLKPLLPEYVSTVDSGNLAACLITLKQACLAMADAPVLPRAAISGLEDTVAALEASLNLIEPASAKPSAPVVRMLRRVTEIKELLAQARRESHAIPAPEPGTRASLEGTEPGDGKEGVQAVVFPAALSEKLERAARSLNESAQKLEEELGRAISPDPAYWCERVAHQVHGLRVEPDSLAASASTREPRRAREAEPAEARTSVEPASPLLLRHLANGKGPEQEEQLQTVAVVRERPTASGSAASQLLARFNRLAERAQALASAMDFAFLYDEVRGIFTTGYNVAAKRSDNSFYDLLASEARLTSFIAVAAGQVPEEHWFQMSRPLTRPGGLIALLSWGGTMFEYLMPPLLMHDYDHTLLHQTNRAVVRAQIDFGKTRHVPWGVSESGFYAFDLQLSYQYQMFGVPSLGLKRELGQDLVVAPYATFLALPLMPAAAFENLTRLASEGLAGSYGYYEAIDYTPSRRPRGQRGGIVRSFMAHHLGMSLVALDNYLNDKPMIQRFHAEPIIAAAELLLQERIPQHAPLVQVQHQERPPRVVEMDLASPNVRRFTTPHTRTPRAQLLSNGAYTVMLTNAGGGYSAFHNVAVTRWRADVTCDAWGSFCYIRDLSSSEVWSTGYQPTTREPEQYEVTFSNEKVEFRRRDVGIETQTEIFVSAEDNAEIRRVRLTNHSSIPRDLELTSYAEVVLDSFNAEAAHPAFSNLFTESEFLSSRNALLFARRQRSADQNPIWAMHVLRVEGEAVGTIECETDRAQFVGRGQTPFAPHALFRPLTNTVGAVLDPIMSLRCRVHLRPGETARVSFATGVADSREGALALIDEFTDTRQIERALDLAWAHSQIQIRHLNIQPNDAHLFQRLASRVLYPDPALRAPAEVLARNVKGQSGLYPYGISGDNPIVVIRIDDAEELPLVREALLAHEFWRLNNFLVDLVILNEHATTYAAGLHGQIQNLIDTSLSRPWFDKPGGVFLRRADQMPEEDRILLQTVAAVVLDGELGRLADQLERSPREEGETGAVRSIRRRIRTGVISRTATRPTSARPRLIFDNGVGGFTQDGREYVIYLEEGKWSPAPWINVLANPQFGCLVSEGNLGYTWSENSQLNRLTPWSNDPVSDRPGEAIYLRDDDTGEVWSPTPLPIREADPYIIHHGAGYTTYEHTSHGLTQELTVFVPKDEPVKVLRLRLRNATPEARRLTATLYAEWVLAARREQAQPFIVTDLDAETGALFARNTYNGEFNTRIAFADVNQQPRTVTADRTTFIGRNGSLKRPAALDERRLMTQIGAGLDPCAAIQTSLELRPRESKELVFLIGQAQNEPRARELIEKYREPAQVQTSLEAVQAQWEDLLGAVQVRTPDATLDVLLNRWMLYQTLACRYWARSAFYQSGGAYGFRDQLQDVMAAVWAAPELTREHILRAAAHQFLEGDVQHWWHPPSGAGVRTRISDDYLWLPFVTHYYVRTTGDEAILDEPLPFLKAPLLEPNEKEVYGRPAITSETASLYQHCLRALDHGLQFGEHGLPLIGTGDWNDGMNSVGDQGKGESVWLGWFLYSNLAAFAEIAAARDDDQRAHTYRGYAEKLQRALNEHAWDGEWYRRAYFDDGTPLGSAQNDECKIDSIAQSWAVISGAAPEERMEAALEAVEKNLVVAKDNLILLLAPPFNKSTPNPGYIQGYVPGIRENGGQYTHAALWFILADVLRGNGDRAAALFDMLNPLNRTRTPEQIARYKVEPYVVVADVYSHPQQLGRGGWTWYTGSAAWMYRVGVEYILGLKRRGDSFIVDPCIPRDWPHYEMTYRVGKTRYDITVENPEGVNRGVKRVEMDGKRRKNGEVPLAEDGKVHKVIVTLGE